MWVDRRENIWGLPSGIREVGVSYRRFYFTWYLTWQGMAPALAGGIFVSDITNIVCYVFRSIANRISWCTCDTAYRIARDRIGPPHKTCGSVYISAFNCGGIKFICSAKLAAHPYNQGRDARFVWIIKKRLQPYKIISIGSGNVAHYSLYTPFP